MKKKTETSYVERIGRVLDRIAKDADTPLQLGELADTAAFSAYHFHRVFRALTGETVQEVVRRVRMSRAAHALRIERATVTETALAAGYGSPEGFARAFRQCFGMSPSAYRTAKAPPPYRPLNTRVHYRPETGSIRLIVDRKEHGMQVEIKDVKPDPIIAWRHVGPYYEVGASFGALSDWLSKHGLHEHITGVFGLSYDDPGSVPEAELRYDACASIRPDTQIPTKSFPENVRVDALPAGRYACTLLEGSYMGMEDCFHRLLGLWLPESGESLDERPCLEWYLNDPSKVAEAELRTLICIPLKG
ncbi:AraC family transcriptional regulator [Nisaea nitritireducens]|uniref:AraC family transcriptional regulator n=1 Tax=Nisaea nitritireducens TaxID=568392 RepID=UPI001866FFDA|nr:GyrI-like domain-containing protein [Nisaea nitritireducens]